MALGKGLSSLIQPKEGGPSKKLPAPETGSADAVLHIPLSDIAPNPSQPRKRFDSMALEELSRSIKQDGVLQPIIVSQGGGNTTKYQIVAGERRWRAAKLAGLREIPAIVREVSEGKESLRIAVLENIQRENLNPIELAQAYARLSQEFKMQQEEIAARVGKSRQVVGNTIRLLTLPQEVQADIAAGVISENHARAILALPSDEMRLKLWRDVKELKLSARNTEVAARTYKKKPSKSVANLDAQSKDAAMKLEAHLGTKVTIEPGAHVSDGGKIVIKYFSNEDLKNIVKKITGQ